jgi:polyketide synthase PksM
MGAAITSDTRQAALATDRFLGQLLLSHLAGLPPLRQGSASRAAVRAAIRPAYHPWLDETWRVLQQQGWLPADDGGEVTIRDAILPLDEAWQAWYHAHRGDPALDAKRKLLHATLDSLADILCGHRQATSVLFTGGSMALVEGIYQGNRVAEYFNTVLAEVIEAYLANRLERGDTSRLRIIEVGAGTGGTSALLLPRLRAHAAQVEEYCYTDISKSFLLHAQSTFGPQHAFVSYQIFNVEKDPVAQGIEVGRYDIVVATNVLHATQQIARTLRNVKAALRPNGLLLLNEISANTLFMHLTFGLLEGWWLAQDPEIRLPGCPGLSPASWQRALEGQGFRDVTFPAAHAHHLGQQIVVAESDGIIALPEREPAASAARAPAVRATAIDKPIATAVTFTSAVSTDRLAALAQDHLRGLVSQVLKVSIGEIDPTEPLETYGIDSILVTRLTDEINQVLQDVSSTVFFEYSTISAIAAHLVETRPEAVARLVGGAEAASASLPPTSPEPALHAVPPPVPQVTPSPLPSPSPLLAPKTSAAAAEPERIAIIGLTARLPMAADLDELWANLCDGRDCITDIPADRWRIDDFYVAGREQALAAGKSYSRWGGFIDGATRFDPAFFGIAPRDAVNIDPHERLFIRACWDALEDGGYGVQRMQSQHGGRVGVFAGITRTGFALHGPDLWRRGQRYFPHTSFSSVANRVSFLFDLRGPSLPVDTQCSSSLVAIHEACRSLLAGDCELALVGAVNLYLHDSSYVLLSAQQMLSEDGRCKAFGAGANGFVPGEGVAALLLKPLSHALRDGDRVHATLLGSAVNHGGRTNGYTVPSPVAQGHCVRAALDRAGIDDRAVGYIEAHGTGTELGDPIEIKGLRTAFGPADEAMPARAIGSIKSNIGHLEAAAGIAGLIKVVLQMRHRQLVPSLHADTLNPRLGLEGSGLKVQTRLAPWHRATTTTADGSLREWPLTAGISSFGASGVNAHVIMQEHRAASDESITREYGAKGSGPYGIVVLSAKRESALRSKAAQLMVAIDRGAHAATGLAALARSTQVHRDAMEERLAVCTHSLADLRDKLARFSDGNAADPAIHRGRVRDHKARIAALADSTELDSLRRDWQQGRAHDRLAALWSQGLKLNWHELYAGRVPIAVDLPSYPYEEATYWLPLDNAEAKTPAMAVAASPPVEPPPSAARWPEATRGRIGIVLADPATIGLPARPSLARPTVQLAELRAAASPALAPVAAVAAGRLMRSDASSMKQTLREKLKASLAELLLIPAEDLAEDCSFVDLGVDSILGVEWVQRLNAKFCVNMRATRLYDHPSLAELAAHIEGETAGEDLPACASTGAAAAVTSKRPSEAPTAQRLAVPTAGPDADALLVTLRDSLAALLFLDRDGIDDETSFVEIGLDSIVGVEWIRGINERYGVNLKASRLYDHTNLASLASYLAGVFAGAADAADDGVTDVEASPVPSIGSAGADASANLLRELTSSLANVLFMPEADIDIDENFVSLGMDSILGVEWVRRLNATLGFQLTATRIYDHTTVRELAAYIERQQAPADADRRRAAANDLAALLDRVQQGEIPAEEAEELLGGLLAAPALR